MASHSADAAHHAYRPPAQDYQMSRRNRSEPITPNSPGSVQLPFRINGPPSSRSWAGSENSEPLELSSGYGRHQAASERTIGDTRANFLPLPAPREGLPGIREAVPEYDQLRTRPPDSWPPIPPAAPQPSTPTLTSSPGDAARTTLPAPCYTHSPSQAKRKRGWDEDSEEQSDSRVPRSYSDYSMQRRELHPGRLYSQPRSLTGGVTLPRLPEIGGHQARSPLDSPQGEMSFRRFEGAYQGYRPSGPPVGQAYDPRHVSHGSYGSYRDDLPDRRPRKRRGNLPKPTTEFLSEWLLAHISHAYPNEEEKQWMTRKTGLTINQISNWFINARRRKVPIIRANLDVEAQMIEASWSPDRSISGADRTPSLDADSRESHASHGESLTRGHESMNRDSN